MIHLQDGVESESFEAGPTTGPNGDQRHPTSEPSPEKRKAPVMLRLVTPNPAPSNQARSRCPDCAGELAVMRVIPGRARSEYWTQRCTECGGIHLDILKAAPISAEPRPGAGADGPTAA